MYFTQQSTVSVKQAYVEASSHVAFSRKMSAGMSADELKEMIARAQASLDNIENVPISTPPKAPRREDSKLEGMRARERQPDKLSCNTYLHRQT